MSGTHSSSDTKLLPGPAEPLPSRPVQVPHLRGPRRSNGFHSAHRAARFVLPQAALVPTPPAAPQVSEVPGSRS